MLWIAINNVIIVSALSVLCNDGDSEFLAKESNDLFWSFIGALTQYDLESPECE